MNTKIQVFNHEQFGEIRTMVMPDGQIGFVGKDVAEVLGYSIPQKAILQHVSEDDRITLTFKAFSEMEKASLWRDNDYSNYHTDPLRRLKRQPRGVYGGCSSGFL